jgi:hypothetical protein
MVLCAKIGTGTEEDPYRPDTNELSWRVIEEYETEFLIEILRW